MHAEVSRLIGMLDMKATRKLRPKEIDRVRSGLCLNCERLATKRGVCKTCYSQFYAKLIRLGSETKAIAFEHQMVTAGKILPVQKARKIKRSDPFTEAA